MVRLAALLGLAWLAVAFVIWATWLIDRDKRRQGAAASLSAIGMMRGSNPWQGCATPVGQAADL